MFSFVTPPPVISPDGSRITYTFSSPQVPGDVWRLERASGALERLTRSPGLPPATGRATDLLAEPTCHEVESFDGERLPVFV